MTHPQALGWTPITTRSGRVSVPPLRLGIIDPKDAGQLCVDYDYETEKHEHALALANGVDLINADDPKNYVEAMESVGAVHWSKACDDEYNGFIKNNTWELVDLPKGRRALGMQWVFTTKLKEDGTVDKHKARTVVRGDQQRPGNDFNPNNIYAPVVGIITLRIILSIVCILNYELFQMDVTQAFLHATVNEEIYVKQIQGYDDGTGRVCKLLKALYGIKQAPHEWNELLHEFMKSNGWCAIESDSCVYHRLSATNQIMIIAVFVDDLITGVATNDVNEYNEFKLLFMNRFTTKDLGDAKWILKMSVQRD